VGVLATTHWQVTKAKEALVTAGVPVLMLDRYDGRPVDAVKVGTVKRAKGLEFKQVLLARVDSTLLGSSPVPASDTDRERRDLDRRELYACGPVGRYARDAGRADRRRLFRPQMTAPHGTMTAAPGGTRVDRRTRRSTRSSAHRTGRRT
jgi:superfamily I DNA/RNA helicase